MGKGKGKKEERRRRRCDWEIAARKS